MKITSKFILAFASLCVAITSTFAQQNQLSQEQKAMLQTQIKIYFEKLNLSEEQKPKFKAITQKYLKQFLELKESNKGRLSKYKTYKALSKNRNNEMQVLLSEQQYETYIILQKEVQQKMIEKYKG